MPAAASRWKRLAAAPLAEGVYNAQILVFLIITVAAAEVAVGLAGLAVLGAVRLGVLAWRLRPRWSGSRR